MDAGGEILKARITKVERNHDSLDITAEFVQEEKPRSFLREALERARERLKETIAKEVEAKAHHFGKRVPTVDTGDGPIIDIEAQPNDE